MKIRSTLHVKKYITRHIYECSTNFIYYNWAYFASNCRQYSRQCPGIIKMTTDREAVMIPALSACSQVGSRHSHDPESCINSQTMHSLIACNIGFCQVGNELALVCLSAVKQGNFKSHKSFWGTAYGTRSTVVTFGNDPDHIPYPELWKNTFTQLFHISRISIKLWADFHKYNIWTATVLL